MFPPTLPNEKPRCVEFPAAMPASVSRRSDAASSDSFIDGKGSLTAVRRTILIVLACAALAGCGGGGNSSSSTSGPPDALLHPAALNTKSPQLFTVVFKTTKGEFVVDVHRTWAPLAAQRFYNLVKAHFFDGVEFFRVVPKFVVQFGISPYPQVSKAWQNATITDDDVTVQNTRGAVTFASAGPNTRTTQVFINLGDNSSLDHTGFAPFGAVVSGMDVVDKLYSGYGDTPTAKQGEMEAQGNAWLKKNYPKLDSIETARVTEESNPALP
jgi:peptidyl-prolyl cis-trans isomerase A (cyclophilin A)